MKNFRFVTYVIIFCALLFGAAVVFSLIKGPQSSSRPTPDTLTQVLAAQSELKRFSTPAELKDFFANRPANSGSSDGYATMQARDLSVKEAAPVAASPGFGGGLGVGEFSNTNIQVQGVDEADLVKTDGGYIYMIKEADIIILKASPPQETTILSTTDVKGTAQELYLSGQYLAVFGYSQSEILPAASIMPRYYAPTTFMAVYNISDRTHPQLLRRLEFEGSYLSSRLIDNHLYFITTYYNFYPLADMPLPRVLENGAVISGTETTDKYIYLPVYYINTPAALNSTTVTVLNLDDIGAAINSQIFLMPAGETVYASTDALYIAYTKYISEYQLRMAVVRELVAPRLNDREQARLNTIASLDDSILSESEKLDKINQLLEAYIRRLPAEELTTLNADIERQFKERHPDLANELEKTVIHKIAFSGSGLNYVASGEVTGRLLNQYSLDEHDHNLRIATTRSQNWFMPFSFLPMADVATEISRSTEPAASVNNVYVLDTSLRFLGAVENLAAGERIYAVRFMGSRAYVVTFKQTDPLFVIDLVDPRSPTVLGELKLPGFSNYLHPYNDTLLLGIGKEAIDKGEQGVDLLGLKVSLLDVADPAAPKEISSLQLGGRGSDSIALFDYKAVLFDKAKELLVIPAALTGGTSTDYRTIFQGALVFTVTDSNIQERGRVSFRLPEEMSVGNQYLDDTVRRNLYIDDALFSISPSTVKVSQLSNLNSITTVNIPARSQNTNPIMPYAEDQTLPAPAR